MGAAGQCTCAVLPAVRRALLPANSGKNSDNVNHVDAVPSSLACRRTGTTTPAASLRRGEGSPRTCGGYVPSSAKVVATPLRMVSECFVGTPCDRAWNSWTLSIDW